MSRRIRIRAATCALAAAPVLLALPGPASARSHAVCSAAPPGYAACLSIVVDQKPSKGGAPRGLNPADLQSAYRLANIPANGRVVAIVDAFDDPNAEADLAHYRAQFGLPACTSANGCFRKVNQNGGTSPLPSPDVGWAEEISLDVDMVSAACPSCHILLVEANDNSFANLVAAVDRAAIMGANAISNSYGGSEYAGETRDQSHYDHAGVAVTVSSGDNGFGVEFPAASQYVTAVGGTALRRSTGGRGWTETAWSGAGSGCSSYVPKPSWQHDAGCARRTVADVSAVASPSTGVSVYDTYGVGGWLVFGGTSASAPLIASVYALAGNARTINPPYYPYGHRAALFDVTSGSNGRCSASALYLCTAGPGYDGPTGLGTPNGTASF